MDESDFDHVGDFKIFVCTGGEHSAKPVSRSISAVRAGTRSQLVESSLFEPLGRNIVHQLVTEYVWHEVLKSVASKY